MMKTEQLIKKLKEIKKEAEEILKKNGTTYEAVLNNKDTEAYGKEGENNNFEAGVIFACNEVLELLGVE
jgi:hypothetical protein